MLAYVPKSLLYVCMCVCTSLYMCVGIIIIMLLFTLNYLTCDLHMACSATIPYSTCTAHAQHMHSTSLLSPLLYHQCCKSSTKKIMKTLFRGEGDERYHATISLGHGYRHLLVLGTQRALSPMCHAYMHFCLFMFGSIYNNSQHAVWAIVIIQRVTD